MGRVESRRIPAAPSNTRSIRRSSSARRSTITTWRATASPTSPMSTPAISPAASRSSPPAKLPFMVGQRQGRLAALDDWYRKYAATEMKDVHYCFAFVHDPGSFHSRTKKIMVPADIKGMKIRPAHAHHRRRWSPSSAAPTCRPRRRKCATCSRGVADAVTFPWGSMVLFGIDKVTKYHMDVPLDTGELRLGDEQGDLRRHVAGAAEGDRRSLQRANGRSGSPAPWADFEHAGIAKLQGGAGPRGLHDHRRAARRMEEGGRAGRRRWSEAVKKAGGDPDTISKSSRRRSTQYNAGY